MSQFPLPTWKEWRNEWWLASETCSLIWPVNHSEGLDVTCIREALTSHLQTCFLFTCQWMNVWLMKCIYMYKGEGLGSILKYLRWIKLVLKQTLWPWEPITLFSDHQLQTCYYSKQTPSTVNSVIQQDFKNDFTTAMAKWSAFWVSM